MLLDFFKLFYAPAEAVAAAQRSSRAGRKVVLDAMAWICAWFWTIEGVFFGK